MNHEIVLILPNQLFEQHPALDKKQRIILLEHPRYFSDFSFHKQKLLLHRASMKKYAHFLERKGHDIVYFDHADFAQFELFLKEKNIATIHMVDPVDHHLQKLFQKAAMKFGIALKTYESPSFLSTSAEITDSLGDRDHYLMNSFYIKQRKNLDLLMHNGKPLGNAWSFDAQNRKKLPSSIKIPSAYAVRENKYIHEAREYVNTNFAGNLGLMDDFIWPIDHGQAEESLSHFLEHQLHTFGPYQDAIAAHHPFLFHSLLSSSLNNGLITPAPVIEKTVAWAQQHKTPLACLEGFTRQIIGWREFVRGVYIIKGEYQRAQNFFDHTNKLAASFWNGTTALVPVDDTIQKVMKYAYAHHIERLMIMGNSMLLLEIDPHEVYRWFMELFIDAYDWVMVPNVYGMSQYADGGLMTTKPYFSGSHYILTMSHYKKAAWCKDWDALYWHFVAKNNRLIGKNPRLTFLKMALQRMDPAVLKMHMQRAQEYMKKSV